MRTLAFSLLMIVVLPVGRHAMAADSATALIEAVSRAASSAKTWDAEGLVVIQESADEDSLQTEAAFRIVMERVPTQRARIEITGVPAPLIRVCDGSTQWGYLPASKQFWSVNDVRIGACAEPFDEWPHLTAELRGAVMTGQEQLHIGERVVDCIVVRGDYSGTSAGRSGKRTLWIEAATNTVSRYRLERDASHPANPAEPAVRTYTLLRQTRDGVVEPGDFGFKAPEGWETPSQIPALRLGDGAPLPGIDHAEPGSGLYRTGNGVRPPVVLRRVPPEYTEAARRARLEGQVVLYAEVWPDGAAHNIKVVRSLEPGLDQKATEAVSKWKFRPGTKDGVPVKVAATFEVNFRMR